MLWMYLSLANPTKLEVEREVAYARRCSLKLEHATAVCGGNMAPKV